MNTGGHPSIPPGVPHPAYARQEVPSKPRPNPTAAPNISYKPSELTIPSKLYDKVPNLDLYKKLTEAERQIDLLSTRKELDFHFMHAKSMQPSNFKRETGFLRVFVYNTCENQPWQKQLLQQQGQPVLEPDAESTWTLRVEGRFLGDNDTSSTETSKPSRQFSSLLSGISVDLIPNEDYPYLSENQSNIIEWRDSNPQQPYKINQDLFDGMDVKRPGIFNLKCKIAILIKDQSAKLKLSDKMSKFMGKQESNQQELIYLIWQYVLYKDLIIKQESLNKVDAITPTTPGIMGINSQGQSENENDLTVVKCDDILQDLLGVNHFRFSELYKLVQTHFQPRDPIIIDYEINTRQSTTLGDVVLDIPVELPLEYSSLQKDVSEENKRIFTNSTQSLGNIADLNSKIALGISSLSNLDMKHQFYKELNENPVEFIKDWIRSQLETLKALKSDENYDEEVVRRAEYFEENEDLLKEKVDLLLGSTKF